MKNSSVAGIERAAAGAQDLMLILESPPVRTEIEAKLAEFDERPVTYSPAEIGRAGAFVSIAADGTLSVDRGYVRPEDELPEGVDGETGEILDDTESGQSATSAPSIQRAVITIGA